MYFYNKCNIFSSTSQLSLILHGTLVSVAEQLVMITLVSQTFIS